MKRFAAVLVVAAAFAGVAPAGAVAADESPCGHSHIFLLVPFCR
jgi:hypothetical protein